MKKSHYNALLLENFAVNKRFFLLLPWWLVSIKHVHDPLIMTNNSTYVTILCVELLSFQDIWYYTESLLWRNSEGWHDVIMATRWSMSLLYWVYRGRWWDLCKFKAQSKHSREELGLICHLLGIWYKRKEYLQSSNAYQAKRKKSYKVLK